MVIPHSISISLKSYVSGCLTFPASREISPSAISSLSQRSSHQVVPLSWPSANPKPWALGYPQRTAACSLSCRHNVPIMYHYHQWGNYVLWSPGVYHTSPDFRPHNDCRCSQFLIVSTFCIGTFCLNIIRIAGHAPELDWEASRCLAGHVLPWFFD